MTNKIGCAIFVGMARIASVVAAGYPHHVTQRGNRRQQTFFNDEDFQTYIDLMTEWCGRCGVEIWLYCLMPNHTHLIAVPAKADSLRTAIRTLGSLCCESDYVVSFSL